MGMFDSLEKNHEQLCCPEEWSVDALQNISGFITKGATPTTYGFDWVDEGIPFFKSDCIKSGKFVYGDFKYISQEAHDSMNRSKIRAGDILISITGDLGKVGRVPTGMGEANINQHMAKIDVREEKADPEFVYQWLLQDKVRKHYDLVKTGLAYPQISLKQVRETLIDLPIMPEQKKIAKILSAVDSHIDEVEDMIEDLQELKKGMMQKLLREGIGHTEFKDSPVGKIPVEWEVKRLGNLIEILSGYPFPSEHFNDEGVGVPLIRIRDLQSSKVSTYYSAIYSNKYIVHSDDILIGMDGDFHTIRWRNSPALLNQRVCKVRSLSEDLMINSYLYHSLTLEVAQIHRVTPATTVKHLSTKDICKITIRIPKRAEQQRIADLLDHFDNRILDFSNKKWELSLLKKGLMQQLLTGKTRVKIDEEN